MSQETDAGKKSAAENFGEMFKAFGNAISDIFNDPELKDKAREFGKSVSKSAKAFGSRLKDEDVKNKFRDVGKAAQNFGNSVADCFEKDNDKDKKGTNNE
jgi:hypothetical protein